MKIPALYFHSQSNISHVTKPQHTRAARKRERKKQKHTQFHFIREKIFQQNPGPRKERWRERKAPILTLERYTWRLLLVKTNRKDGYRITTWSDGEKTRFSKTFHRPLPWIPFEDSPSQQNHISTNIIVFQLTGRKAAISLPFMDQSKAHIQNLRFTRILVSTGEKNRNTKVTVWDQVLGHWNEITFFIFFCKYSVLY